MTSSLGRMDLKRIAISMCREETTLRKYSRVSYPKYFVFGTSRISLEKNLLLRQISKRTTISECSEETTLGHYDRVSSLKLREETTIETASRRAAISERNSLPR